MQLLRTIAKGPAALLITASLAACSANDEAVLFVTKTSLGLDLDSTPATVNIAYDRREGFIGPIEDEAELPPVVAAINTNAEFFSPKVQQVYATGDAAIAVTEQKGDQQTTAQPAAVPAAPAPAVPAPAVPAPAAPAPAAPAATDPTQATNSTDDETKIAFFGTSSAIGLKAGFNTTTGMPDSFLFGYRRKEVSLIPFGKKIVDGEEVKTFPSVFASIDSTGNATNQDETGLKVKQFFATGLAAVNLGNNPDVKGPFKKKAKDALALYEDSTTQQEAQAVRALKCAPGVTDDKLEDIIQSAIETGMFHDGAAAVAIVNDLTNAKLDPPNKHDLYAKVRHSYSNEIGNQDGADPGRADKLKAHADLVCSLV